MATSSITKDFYVKDQKAFKRLKNELEHTPQRVLVVKSPSLERGREKLAAFTFGKQKSASDRKEDLK